MGNCPMWLCQYTNCSLVYSYTLDTSHQTYNNLYYMSQTTQVAYNYLAYKTYLLHRYNRASCTYQPYMCHRYTMHCSLVLNTQPVNHCLS